MSVLKEIVILLLLHEALKITVLQYAQYTRFVSEFYNRRFNAMWSEGVLSI